MTVRVKIKVMFSPEEWTVIRTGLDIVTVQGKDVRVDGLATAIKKMFDFMTSDGKGFYE